MNIVFRVDASSSLGTGHLMRCLTLADILKQNGCNPTFISHIPAQDRHIADLIKSHCQLLLLPPPCNSRTSFSGHKNYYEKLLKRTWNEDAELTSAAINGEMCDWLIVDHYALDRRWHEKMRLSTKKIFVIDDLANRPLFCDLLLDQTYGRTAHDYRGFVPDHCKLLLGSSYALLRPQFAEKRHEALTRRAATAAIKRIFIGMGGMDPHNLTSLTMHELESVPWKEPIDIDVVLEHSAPNIAAVQKASSELSLNIRVHPSVGNIAKLMYLADLAIGGGGTMSWERCSLGLPSIVVTYADNQHRIARNLHDAGAIWYLGDYDEIAKGQIRESIIKIQNDFSLLNKMSKIAAAICDGEGSKKVYSALVS